MGLPNPRRTLGRFLLLSIFPKLSKTLSGMPPFFMNLFRLASFFALLVGLDLSFLIGLLAWFFKITKVTSFESVEVFRKDPFLALYFSLSSSMILFFCHLPSAALFTLTTWPFGPPLLGPYCGVGYTRSSDSTWALVGVLVSSSQSVKMWGLFLVDPTKLISSPMFSCSTPLSISIALQLSLGSLSTAALFPFLNMYLRWRPSSSLVSRPYAVSLLPHGVPLRSPPLFGIELFFGQFSLMLHPNGFLF